MEKSKLKPKLPHSITTVQKVRMQEAFVMALNLQSGTNLGPMRYALRRSPCSGVALLKMVPTAQPSQALKA